MGEIYGIIAKQELEGWLCQPWRGVALPTLKLDEELRDFKLIPPRRQSRLCGTRSCL